MTNLLMRMKRHPFPVVAHFDRVVALSFAFPAELLRPLLPPPLMLDAYEGLGFVTVALVWTRGLRPAGLPKFLGQDFFLAGYRVFARLRDSDGRRRRTPALRSAHSQIGGPSRAPPQPPLTNSPPP